MPVCSVNNLEGPGTRTHAQPLDDPARSRDRERPMHERIRVVKQCL